MSISYLGKELITIEKFEIPTDDGLDTIEINRGTECTVVEIDRYKCAEYIGNIHIPFKIVFKNSNMASSWFAKSELEESFVLK